MVNTAPPPGPSCLNGYQPVLTPAPLPSQGHPKPLIRVLVGVVVLHVLLSVGGFIYLYYNDKAERRPTADAGALLSSEMPATSSKALARMVVKQPRTPAEELPGYLQWDMNHSVRRNISYYHNSWLTILHPGDYYVYSRVSFCKGDSVRPLTSRVMLRKNENEKTEKIVMQTHCNLNSAASVPHLCTATQGEVVTLEKGNQLSVWIHDLSLVDYDEGATSFGMYRL